MPWGVAFTPDGVYAFVTDQSSRSVSVIATDSTEVVDSVASGCGPWGIGISTVNQPPAQGSR